MEVIVDTDDGTISPARRFDKLEKRVDEIDKTLEILRIEWAKQQTKLALLIGAASFAAYTVCEFAFLYWRK